MNGNAKHFNNQIMIDVGLLIGNDYPVIKFKHYKTI
jgi:hypothetical protein